MKKFIILSIFFTIVLSGCAINTNNIYDSFFDDSYISEINIELSTEDYQDILDNPTAEEYKEANIVIDDQTLLDVGFRTKGNSSLRNVASSDSDRYSYRIKTDKYVENQTTKEGITDFVLNNMFFDPTYMREYISYKVLKDSQLATPNCKYIKVSINGEYKGLYLMVENIEKPFLKNNFGDDSGNLYKANERSTLLKGSEENLELKSGDDKEKLGLINLIEVLNNENTTKEDIEQVMDVESFLKNIAFNTVFGSYDSYNGKLAHNYYLYEIDNKFYMIPWDYNMSFAGFSQGGDDIVTNIPIYEPLSGVDLENRPLINKLLSFDEYKKEYVTYIKEYNDYLNDVPNMVSEIDELIKEEVENDPTSFYTYEQYEKSITYDEDYEFMASKNKVDILNDKEVPPEGQIPPPVQSDEDLENMKVLQEGKVPENQGNNTLDSTPPPILNYVKARYEFILSEFGGTSGEKVN